MRGALGLISILALAAQTVPAPNDEVRVSSRAYLPFHLRVESNLVEISAVVRDPAGHAVAGLKQSDFQLFEEGKPREIFSFSAELHPHSPPPATMPATALPTASRLPSPRYIAMFFDDTGTSSGKLSFTKTAARKFVDNSLQSTDRVAIFTSSAGRATNFLADHATMNAAIDRVQAHDRFSQQDTAACPRITPYDAYRIAILMDEDAIHAATTSLSICGLGLPQPPATPRVPGRVNRLDPARDLVLTQAEQIWQQVRTTSQNTIAAISGALADLARLPVGNPPATRMLLLVSSGFMTGTLEREQDLIVDQALKSSIVINSLDAKGVFAELPGHPFGEDQGPGGDPPEVFFQETMNAVDRKEAPSSILASLAVSTGGLYFHHNNNFSEGFNELGAVPEASYTIGFRPDGASLDGKYHRLKLRLVSAKSSSIQARPGYFAAPKSTSEDAGRAALEHEVTSTAITKDFPATVEGQLGSKAADGITPLKVRMHVDLKSLEFPEQNGRHLQKLTFVFALLDKERSIVSAREGVMEFSAADAKFQSLMDSGVNALLTLQAPPGTYLLRAVAIEGVRSKIASLSAQVIVP